MSRVAELYIIPESFQENNQYSQAEIEDKIKLLSIDFTNIRRYSDTNKLYVLESIYDVEFINGIKILELLYNDEVANSNLDRDTRVALKNIILNTQISNDSTEDIITVLLPEHDENICHGVIAFHLIDKIFEKYQLVYNYQGWLAFRRHFLGVYPIDSQYYISECRKYFPNLFFHDRNVETINTIFDDCPKKVLFHLAALNDRFRDILTDSTLNRTEVLQKFSIEAQLDETASLEGDADRKVNFTFTFLDKDNVEHNVCCEPHLKLCYNDDGGDSSYSTNRRIYFHEGVENISDGKILIGHIGNHL